MPTPNPPPVPVLMVDDRRENLLALEGLLDGMGLTLIEASSGPEALKWLLKEDFAVILMDVQMPGMNGFETVQLIKQREKSRDVPIIFLTAINKEDTYALKGYAMGAVDYITKPYDPEILRSKVAVFVELYRKNLEIKRQAELLRQADRRERRRQLSELERASRQRYRDLADAMPQIVWTADPQGYVSYFNLRWYDYTQSTPEQSLGHGWNNVLHPEDRERALAEWREVLAANRPLEAEYRFRRGSDGSYRWHLARALPIRDDEGKVGRWVGTATDIDDRKREQQALQELTVRLESQKALVEAEVRDRTRELADQKRFVQRLLDHAPAGIAFVDRDLIYRWANPQFCRIMGFVLEPDQVIGRAAGDLGLVGMAEATHPEAARVRDIMQAELEKVVTTQTPYMATGMPAPPSALGAYWDLSGFPLTSESGEVEGVLIFVVDVTARLENERLQREQIAHLRQVDVMKDEFLSILSHELRTPINAITGFGSILDDGIAGELTTEQHHYLQKMLSGADILLSLINDLLDMSRIQAGKFTLNPARMTLDRVVRDVVADLTPFADRKRIHVTADIPEGLPTMVADAQRVRQVLVNLINNAIKFTPDDGVVEVTVRPDDTCVEVAVRDTGIGIAEADFPRLFQRFTQLDSSATRRAGGTGLGLAIAKSLVESHGGSIGVKSRHGEGSTFWFRLPLAGPGGGDYDGDGPEQPTVAQVEAN